MKRIIKWTIFMVLALFGLLLVYSAGPSKPSTEMYSNIGVDLSIDVTREFNHITYEPEFPLGNIVFVPGGKVQAESYEYIAYKLAENGYKVTIIKPVLNLAILQPNLAKKYLSEDLENTIIGHSLGGVVASMVAEDNSLVGNVILLAAYSTVDITDKSVLVITAEFDTVLDGKNLSENNSLMGIDSQLDISGGNHAQFGWYGTQSKDGKATITTKEQQDIVIMQVLEFLT